MYEIQEIEIDLPNQRDFDSKRFSDAYEYFTVSVLNIDIDDQEEITLEGSVTLRFERVETSLDPYNYDTVGQYSHCEIHLKYNGADKIEIENAIRTYIEEHYEK